VTSFWILDYGLPARAQREQGGIVRPMYLASSGPNVQAPRITYIVSAAMYAQGTKWLEIFNPSCRDRRRAS
jgi:hypothetical protein